jgi:hypothetical protein
MVEQLPRAVPCIERILRHVTNLERVQDYETSSLTHRKSLIRYAAGF